MKITNSSLHTISDELLARAKILPSNEKIKINAFYHPDEQSRRYLLSITPRPDEGYISVPQDSDIANLYRRAGASAANLFQYAARPQKAAVRGWRKHRLDTFSRAEIDEGLFLLYAHFPVSSINKLAEVVRSSTRLNGVGRFHFCQR